MPTSADSQPAQPAQPSERQRLKEDLERRRMENTYRWIYIVEDNDWRGVPRFFFDIFVYATSYEVAYMRAYVRDLRAGWTSRKN